MVDKLKNSKAPKKKKVMVVEDDKFLARALTSKLKNEGFSVETFYNGQEVLDALKKSVPDILLLDLIMPGKDGFTILKEIRDDANLKKLPVIILSNLSQSSDITITKDLGVLEHLVKADTPLSTIIEKVKNYLKN